MIGKNIRLVENRTRFLCGKFLENIQKTFPHVTRNGQWANVRTSILDMSNDVIRANRADFDCLEDSYRVYPFVLSCNAKNQKTISFSNAALRVFQSIYFFETPYSIVIKVKASDYNIEVIKHILKTFVFGEIKYEQGFVLYKVQENDCIKVIDILNMIPFKESIKTQYEKWRKNLDDWYFAHGDW